MDKGRCILLASTLIGETLRSARNKANLSVNHVVSKLLGDYQIQVSAKTLYGWEASRSQPDIDTFLALCQIYNISMFELSQLGKNITLNFQGKTILDTLEYPVIAKYRRLNDSGKEYIDAQLDFALSQEKYKAKTPLATEQAEAPDDVDDLVDVSFAAYGGESGTFQITHKEYDEVKELFDAYDYTKDK